MSIYPPDKPCKICNETYNWMDLISGESVSDVNFQIRLVSSVIKHINTMI